MTAPRIEMIVESLKNCSLGRRNRGGGARRRDSDSPPAPEPEQEQDDQTTVEKKCVTVELNSEIRLPCDWEQCLDLRTGELYYINWKTGMKTSDDPRFSTYYYYYSSSSSSSSSTSSSDAITSDDDTAFSSGASSCSSTGATRASDEVLVAAGCKACFMYFMVPKRVGECPKCGGALLHLGGGGGGF